MAAEMWTKEQEDYLRYLYSKDCLILDFVSDFNNKFNTNRSKSSLIHKASKMGINNNFYGDSRYNYVKNTLDKQQRIGQTKMSNDGTLMKIIDYIDALHVLIEFQDEFKFQTWVEYNDFKKGTVRNPYWKLMYNIGYVGVGPYEQTVNKKITKAYDAWHRMFDRCYSDEHHKKYPTYVGCQVCEEWHNFQNFAKWFYDNYYEVDEQAMEVDKDWYVVGNQTYCPENCCVVPSIINSCILTHDKIKNHDMPIGVSWHKNGSYVARCSDHGKRRTIGYYHNVKDAETAYWNYKISYISILADEYKEYIPNRLYNAMKDFKNTYKERYKLSIECEVN